MPATLNDVTMKNGPDGLLKQPTRTVMETALGEEMTEHLGYEKEREA